MCNRKIAVIVMTATIAVLLTACNGNSATTGHDTQQTTTVAGTVSQPKSTEAATTASDNASAEEISKKAEEIKSSMAAAVEQASREAESLAEAARQEAESRAAATQAAGEAVETALRGQAAQLANDTIGADGEITTVVDDYGVESARLQYAANYNVYVELVRLTNELRASLGVAPLTMDENICIASCKKAIDYDLADYYDGDNHTMIDGRRWQALYEDFNIVATARAENIAEGPSFKTAKAMFEGWKNSKIHYTNMVNPAYTRVGVGTCGYVWIMNFAN